jgi:RimJ/RimL family protein N-acetyltransferase
MTPDRLFNDSYREELALPDGSRMRLRLVGPADREGLILAFGRLSVESRIQRWFYPKMRLTEAEIEAILSPADEHHGGILAAQLDAAGNEEAGIGMARFVRNPLDPAAAEIAITIVDDWQGMGLGRILLHRLLAMMSERRIAWAEGRLQAENRRMRRLLDPYVPLGGFQRDGDTLTFRFAVPRTGDPLMAQLARNAAAVAHLFKRMAEDGVLLPLALAEKHLQSAGSKAVLEALQREDQARTAPRSRGN